MSRLKLLLLGGTTEARELARLTAGDDRFEGTLSLAGMTRSPAPSPLETRTGGFGGAGGLADYLRRNGIDVLVDATHPFASTISANAVAAAAAAGIPCLAVQRPAWEEVPGDRWVHVPDIGSAADALGKEPRRVFLTIGRKDLAPFRDGSRHRYIVRSVDPPPSDLLPPNATVIVARGPFALADEERLLRDHRIDTIVTKNSGGSATAAKLAAARLRGIPVVMVDRPPPAGPAVPTVEDAWRRMVAHHAGTGALRGV